MIENHDHLIIYKHLHIIIIILNVILILIMCHKLSIWVVTNSTITVFAMIHSDS